MQNDVDWVQCAWTIFHTKVLQSQQHAAKGDPFFGRLTHTTVPTCFLETCDSEPTWPWLWFSHCFHSLSENQALLKCIELKSLLSWKKCIWVVGTTTKYTSCIIEMCPWNLCDLINQRYPSKFYWTKQKLWNSKVKPKKERKNIYLCIFSMTLKFERIE